MEEKDGILKTREEVIELKCAVDACLRKAQCREVHCDVIDALASVSRDLDAVDGVLTEIIEGTYE